MEIVSSAKSSAESLYKSPWQESLSAGSEAGVAARIFLDEYISDFADRLSSSSSFLRQSQTEILKASSQDLTAKGELPTVIFLKQQKDKAARERQVEQVAGELAKFISGAQKSLDISIYSFNVRDPEAQKTIVDALNERAKAGVAIRLAYFQSEKRGFQESGENENEPGNKLDAGGSETESQSYFLSQLDPSISVQSTQGAIKLPGELSDEVERAPIRGSGQLMHNKYLVRDAGSANAAVWTGSTNFTDDAFGNQDNNIVQIKSAEIAGAFKDNFNEMWESGNIAGTGKDGNRTAKVGSSTVTVAFSPGDGEFMERRIASEIAQARTSINIASMAISNYHVLKALSKELDEGTRLEGIYDKSQMDNVVRQWERNDSASSREKVQIWNKVKEHLVAKNTASPMHGMMHNKTVQIDDSVVVTGSFNFSSNAARNAENLVVIQSPELAKQYGAYISDLVLSYGSMSQ